MTSKFSGYYVKVLKNFNYYSNFEFWFNDLIARALFEQTLTYFARKANKLFIIFK